MYSIPKVLEHYEQAVEKRYSVTRNFTKDLLQNTVPESYKLNKKTSVYKFCFRDLIIQGQWLYQTDIPDSVAVIGKVDNWYDLQTIVDFHTTTLYGQVMIVKAEDRARLGPLVWPIKKEVLVGWLNAGINLYGIYAENLVNSGPLKLNLKYKK